MGPDSNIKILAAHREDFLDLYDQDFHRVVKFMVLNGASAEEATDAAQEAFVEAWNLVQSGQWGTLTSPAGWLRTVALRRYLRPRGARMTPLADLHAEVPDKANNVPDLADDVANADWVLQALQRLPPTQRAVVAMGLDGIPTQHIAEVLGINETTVRAHRHAARKKLRTLLATQDQQNTPEAPQT